MTELSLATPKARAEPGRLRRLFRWLAGDLRAALAILVLLVLVKFPVQSSIILQIIQWISFIISLFFIFGLLYRYLPNQKDARCSWVSPGSLTAIVLWVLVTNGFRVYLIYFDNYDKTYGSLGAVIILMLWLYLTALVILIGGSLNSIIAELQHKNLKVDSLCENDEPESKT